MLKGIQKNMMFIQLPRSCYFEGAYFVIRAGKREPRSGEMIKEANKIISDAGLVGTQKKAKASGGKDKATFFIYGGVAGSLAVALAWLLTLFFF